MYHPEQHYMRGPGPKWLEKHVGHRTGASLQDDIGRLSKLMRRIALRLRWLPPSATAPSEQSSRRMLEPHLSNPPLP
jgi:hypothetical protein